MVIIRVTDRPSDWTIMLVHPPESFLDSNLGTLGSNNLQFGMLMYPDLCIWLNLGHGLLIVFILL